MRSTEQERNSMARLPRNRRTRAATTNTAQSTAPTGGSRRERPASVPPQTGSAPSARISRPGAGNDALALYGYGLIASALGAVASLLIRLLFGMLTPAEIFADR